MFVAKEVVLLASRSTPPMSSFILAGLGIAASEPRDVHSGGDGLAQDVGVAVGGRGGDVDPDILGERWAGRPSHGREDGGKSQGAGPAGSSKMMKGRLKLMNIHSPLSLRRCPNILTQILNAGG